jgi:hypothetical protein
VWHDVEVAPAGIGRERDEQRRGEAAGARLLVEEIGDGRCPDGAAREDLGESRVERRGAVAIGEQAGVAGMRREGLPAAREGVEKGGGVRVLGRPSRSRPTARATVSGWTPSSAAIVPSGQCSA